MEAHTKKKAGRKRKKKKSKNECFFRLDGSQLPRVCKYNDMNMLIQYAVMVYGTGKDHRTSKYSARSGVNWGGISSWDKANAAIERLMKEGVVERFESGRDADDRPMYRYDLKPSEEPDFIWLPDSIVQGVIVRGRKIIPPLQQLKSTNNVLALRLLFHLYQKHELVACGGTSALWVPYHGETIQCEVGAYSVWKFTEQYGETLRDKLIVDPRFLATYSDCEDDFWKALELLFDYHLVEIVPHLFLGDTLSHPLRATGRGDDELHEKEKEVTEAAHDAAWAMKDVVAARATRAQGIRVKPGGNSHPAILEGSYYVPVRKHISPEVRGVLRLKHRPQTLQTKQWYSRYHNEIPGYISAYRQLEEWAKQTLASEAFCAPIRAINMR